MKRILDKAPRLTRTVLESALKQKIHLPSDLKRAQIAGKTLQLLKNAHRQGHLGLRLDQSAAPFRTVFDKEPQIRPLSSQANRFELPRQVQDRTLTHLSLDKGDIDIIKRRIGEDAFNELEKIRHREGGCHMDTVLALEIVAGTQPVVIQALPFLDPTKEASRFNLPTDGILGVIRLVAVELGNSITLFIELAAGNLKPLSKEELLDKGMPEDAFACIISARTGVLDPKSKQAWSIEPDLNTGEAAFILMAGNHSIGVLEVDKQAEYVYGVDFDPYRDGSVFFKTRIPEFEQKVKVDALGCAYVKKKAE